MVETKFKCEKCGTEATSKYCPSCGHRLQPEQIRSQAQIRQMKDLVERAAKIKANKKDTSPVDMVLTLLTTITLEWVLGKDMSPLQMMVRDEGKNDPEIQSLLELEKMFN